MKFRLIAALIAAPLAAAAQEVTLETGQVRGVASEGVSAWLGLPFAAPPTGSLRWRAPQPAAPWSGVRDATTYGSDCMQAPFPGMAVPLRTRPAEDCLNANVWAPAKARGLPVLVWIHGGGFVNGGSSQATTSGRKFASQGVVVVSFNYRLGRFGRFAHPQLTRDDPDGGHLGNYGLMDQIAALKWVRRNVAAFGGDPSMVTLMGESAGGMSINTLIASPAARDLFRAAIVMSGGDATEPRPATTSLADAETIGVNFAATKGIGADDPQALSKLRALSAEQVTDGLNLVTQSRPPPGPPTYSGGWVEGNTAQSTASALKTGRFAKMPVMIGATSADMGGKTGWMVAGARNTAGQFAAHGVPVYSYRFSYVAQSLNQPGARHATDVPFFFNTQGVKYGAETTARDNRVGATVSSYVINFVKSGDPNEPGLPAWPRFSRASDMIMDFAADGQAVPQKDPWGADLDAAAISPSPPSTSPETGAAAR